jgi:endonuclease-3
MSSSTGAARASRLIAGLKSLYPDANCELHHTNALELLVATVLSAQCTDQRVNGVTPALFAAYRTAADYAKADPARLSQLIHATGFFRNKAKAIIGLSRALLDNHGGEVPEAMDDLAKLPGVGRKTANVLRSVWFRRPAIPVDTHVQRLVGRLELSKETDPVKIERTLQELLPEEDWSFFATALIWHGRRVCFARNPQCAACTLRADCPFPERCQTTGIPAIRSLY